MKEMIISILGDDVQVALLKDGKLWHFFVEETEQHHIRGNIYVGYVERVLPGLESAFIDIGLERCGFLHRKDMITSNSQAPISDLVAQGQYLVVQVLKDPIARKGARLSTALTLSSWYLVYEPHGGRGAISQSIEDSEERVRLEQWLNQHPGLGIIVRTAAAYQPFEKLSADLERLKKRAAAIKKISIEKSHQIGLIHEEEVLPMRIFRDFMKYGFNRVTVNHADCGQALEKIALEHDFPITINIVSPLARIFSEHQIYDQFAKALARYVPLRSGANLVIEQTESMITIDVNTSRFIGKKDHRQTILQTNLEAAKAIAEHVQLRELGGIIVIDFIDMPDKEDRDLLHHAFCDFFSDDHMPVHILPMSALGLVQMTRKRYHDSVMEQFRERCPSCSQKAPIMHHRLLALQIVDKILSFSPPQSATILIVARANVINYLQQKEDKWKKSLGFSLQQWNYHIDESNDLNFYDVYLEKNS